MTEEEFLSKNQKEETLELPCWGPVLLLPSYHQPNSQKVILQYSVQGTSFLFVSLNSIVQFCCWLCYEQDWTTAVNTKWKRDELLQLQGLEEVLDVNSSKMFGVLLWMVFPSLASLYGL